MPGMSEKWTYDDLALLPQDGLRHELIDGVHYVNASPIVRHQVILYRLVLAISKYLEERPLVQLSFAPMGIPSQYDLDDRDLRFLGDKLHEIVILNDIQGTPSLLIEVLSQSDMTQHSLYERTGVSEYWIVDPVADAVRIFRRNAAGRYERAAELSSGDVLTSPLLPTLEIPIDTIFAAW